MFSPDQWAASTGVAFYNGVATQSLRYNDDDNPYLSKTFSAGNAKTWTWSGWVKLSSTTVSNSFIYSQLSSGSDVSWLYFTSNNQLNMQSYEGGNQLDIMTNAKFRDTSAWYHIMAVLDTTQSTSTDRAKMYVNGELQTSLANTTYPSQNADLKFNNGDAPVLIGGTPDSYGTGAGYKLDGYLAEVNFVDGQALTPTSFGETKNGVWIPIEYTGSYGTNGFRLQFNQTGTGTASSSTIGADTSGNNHHFTSSGIVASDCNMPDSPENNWCTLNPLWYPAGTLSEGNLKFIPTVSSDTGTVSTFVPTAKSYWEVYIVSGSASSLYMGIVKTSAISNNYNTSSADWVFSQGSGAYRKYGTLTSGQTTWGASDILGLAYDTEATTLYVYKNNALISTITGLEDVEHYVLIAGNTTSEVIVANFGQDSSFAGNATAQGNTDANGNGDFYYSPPSGYLALCTANLPEPTISPNADTQADDYFNTVEWTGNATARSISGVGFQADWLWFKRTDASDNHHLIDSVRGLNGGTVFETLYSNLTSAEANDVAVTAFNSDGFDMQASGNGNNSGRVYVGWNWKAGGTAVSNTDGTITSSVSANTDAGFSIVTYTGTKSTATVGHGLGVAPNVIIFKNRDDGTKSWITYHSSLGESNAIFLDTTSASVSDGDYMNGTAPTSTLFHLAGDDKTNASSQEILAYCFAEIEGYSKFGTYTGNGSTDGTFIYTGFRPAFVMVKNASVTQSWRIWDTARNPTNETNLYLTPNGNGAEGSTSVSIDILSNGFKPRGTNASMNGSGNTMVYMAFAETPFRYANAR